MTRSLILSIVAFVIALAQEVHVIAVKGKVEVSDNGTWCDVRAGTSIRRTSKIKIERNSYAAILTLHGNAIELKNMGVYDIDSLLTFYRKSSYLYSSKYTGYVLNQAIAHGSSPWSGKTLGAVTRSSLGVNQITPRGTKLYGHLVILEWEPVVGSGGYCVEIVDSRGRPVFVKDYPENQCIIALNLNAIDQQDTLYYWRVNIAKYHVIWSPYRSFIVLRGHEQKAIMTEEQTIRSEIEDNTALGQMILGAFYEQKELYAYALQCYKKAYEMHPEVEIYKNMYLKLYYKY